MKNILQPSGRSGSVSMKLLVIGFLLFLFLPATFMVQELVYERQARQDDAAYEVSEKWGGQQIISGPILAIPYDNAGLNKYAYFSPELLKIDGDVKTELRTRGIYDVPLYTGDIKLSGNFSRPDFASLGIAENRVRWEQASISIGIPDMRGVTERVSLSWLGKSSAMTSGTKVQSLEYGVMSSVSAGPEISNYQFSAELKLRGSSNLSFLPVGKTTSVYLKSDWISPSFAGSFLPVEHVISAEGFEANWSVLDLNKSFPQQWKETDNLYIDPWIHGFGVNLYQPVDTYQKTERSAKYAIAVIMLVFLVFFLVEVTSDRRIHPLQYIMIGFALVIFYTLLLSFAEYVRFGLAYIIASVAVITMVTLYSKSVMQNWRLALTNGGILAFLYLFIYVLLQMEDFTLLIGSLGLFAILAAVMYVTRNIDWYRDKA